MNFKNISLQKLFVLYLFSVLPVVSIYIFMLPGHPASMPVILVGAFSILFALIITLVVPAAVALALYGVYKGVYFLCSNEK